VPRGARPWMPDEAKTKLAGEFNEHVERAHVPSDTEGMSNTTKPKERP